MIFQLSIDLEIPNKNAKAVIDLDTGFIGFNESIEGQEKEYYFSESPIEFRKAMIKCLEPILSERISTNWKICRKNEHIKYVNKYLNEQKKADNNR